MAAIQNLCTRGIYLRNGALVADGPVEQVLTEYLTAGAQSESVNLGDRQDRSGNGQLRFLSLQFLDSNNHVQSVMQSGAGNVLRVEIENRVEHALKNVAVSLAIDDDLGMRIAHLSNEVTHQVFPVIQPGRATFDVHVPKLPLKSGAYSFTLFSTSNGEICDWVQNAISFQVDAGDFFGTGKLPPEGQGNFFIDHSFKPLQQ